MSETAEKSDPELWDKVKAEVTASDKGGKPGQWSARKAQMAVHEYKEEGGGYKGKKTADNRLVQWGEEDWGTKSGKPSGETGERYLPKEARQHLSKDEYARTTKKKRADTREGKQHSAQPADVARKTAPYRESGHAHDESRSALFERAKAKNIPGRSKMTKDELAQALAKA
jgi:hypothetical protein